MQENLPICLYQSVNSVMRFGTTLAFGISERRITTMEQMGLSTDSSPLKKNDHLGECGSHQRLKQASPRLLII